MLIINHTPKLLMCVQVSPPSALFFDVIVDIWALDSCFWLLRVPGPDSGVIVAQGYVKSGPFRRLYVLMPRDTV